MMQKGLSSRRWSLQEGGRTADYMHLIGCIRLAARSCIGLCPHMEPVREIGTISGRHLGNYCYTRQQNQHLFDRALWHCG